MNPFKGFFLSVITFPKVPEKTKEQLKVKCNKSRFYDTKMIYSVYHEIYIQITDMICCFEVGYKNGILLGGGSDTIKT